ncbi:uncharacterized protein LOC131623761 [Vicia villosa]|uniref:uncharacterized protein LOC131623761 n=1 Tax=Vicia villosa TaxID=3911 RepID=UPI00273B3BE9|nr:uncharacterized protein LOC131623761 [Vicia villosa]
MHSTRRHRRGNSSFVLVPVTTEAGSSVPPLVLYEDDPVPEPVWYPRGPIDASQLTGYADHSDRDPQRFYNHGQKIGALAQLGESWFQDALAASELRDLCQVGFQTIHDGMMMTFAERWHPDTSSFHLPHGEINITLDDIACLLHLPIIGTILGHGRLAKEEAVEMLIEELGADPTDVLEEVERTRGAHVRFHSLQRIYDAELLAAHEVAGNEEEADIHRERVLRCWILQHFPDIIDWGEVSGYTKVMTCARACVPLRANQVLKPYRHCFDRMADEDVRYDCYDDQHETVPWNDIALYSGWLVVSSTIIVRYLLERVMRQFGYQQTISRHPSDFAPIAMTRR